MKKLFKRTSKEIVQTALYGGLTREEYNEIREEVSVANKDAIRSYSLVCAILFCLLTVMSMIIGGNTTNSIIPYVINGVFSFTLFFLTSFIKKMPRKVTMLLFYLFMTVIYLSSLVLEYTHLDYSTVTGIVLMVILPLLFTDRPIRMIGVTLCYAAGIALISIMFKDPAIVEFDIYNILSFLFIAIIIETLLLKIRYKSAYQAHILKYLSGTDVLTGLYNRNKYETKIESYPKKCKTSITCIYADVNGLHELNNEKGHHEGDKLLQAAAVELVKHFGVKNTFRMGGDEFVIFAIDKTEAEIIESKKAITDALAEKNYSISIGFATAPKTTVDMAALVRNAEEAMFNEKDRYYIENKKKRR